MLVAYLLCMLIFSCLLPQSPYSHSHPSHSHQALLIAGVIQSTRKCILGVNKPKSLTHAWQQTQDIFLEAAGAQALKLYVHQIFRLQDFLALQGDFTKPHLPSQSCLTEIHHIRLSSPS